MKYSKNKSTKYISSSKLINENTMEKSALAKEKINIQINNVREESKERLYESKEKKNEKRVKYTRYCIKYNLSIIYGKTFQTAKNGNDHLGALNTDVMDNRDVRGNCLNNSRLHLNNTWYDKLAINVIKKMKI